MCLNNFIVTEFDGLILEFSLDKYFGVLYTQFQYYNIQYI